MGSINGRIVYIDGFAGPGRYSKGEEGSPLIALKALLDHPLFRESKRNCNVVFFFIEADQERANALRGELNQLVSERPLPGWVEYDVRDGEFADEMTKVLNKLEGTGKHLAPTFAFIDPFGYKGLPLEIIARIVRNDRCECLINFMYEAFTRHAGKPIAWIQSEFDELFGTNAWQDLLSDSDPKRRFEGAVDLYRTQLIQVAKLKYVRTFVMLDQGNQPEYVLFFGTNNQKGLSQMKQAMWKADPISGQIFSDRTDAGQMVLIKPGSEMGLRDLLLKRYKDKGYVKIEDIERFVLIDTPYSEVSHLKKKTLAPMEKESPPIIKVQRPSGSQNRAGTYPEGTKIRFV